MSHYFRTPEMQNGGPFRCFNCNRQLAIMITGDDYYVKLKCPRCKAIISMKMKEPVSWQAKREHEHNGSSPGDTNNP